MRFDWYSWTEPDLALGEVIQSLRSGLPELITGAERCDRKVLGWGIEDRLLDCEGHRVCSVLSGGHNARYGVHISSSGVYSQDVAEFGRKWWPGHRVSRVDVAIDFDGPGSFDKLHGLLLEVVGERPFLKYRQMGDFRENRNPLDSRTIYVGSRNTGRVVRLYEKGWFEISKRKPGEDVSVISPNWCRLEYELHPPNEAAKILASSLQPPEFWGCSPWTRSILQRSILLDVERVRMTVRRESDARRAFRHMTIQYRDTWDVVRAELGGSDQDVLDFRRRILEEEDRLNASGQPAWAAATVGSG